jgi:excisionase family DNA binding protein
MADSETDVVADGVMSVADAMKFTGLGKTEVYKRIADGSLPFVRPGKRRLMPRKALVELLRSGLVGEGKRVG